MQVVSSVSDGHSRPHGNSGPSHRGDGDHGRLAQLDRGLPAAQTRGRSTSAPHKLLGVRAGTLTLSAGRPGADPRVRGAASGARGPIPQVQRPPQVPRPVRAHQRGAASAASGAAGGAAQVHERQQVRRHLKGSEVRGHTQLSSSCEGSLEVCVHQCMSLCMYVSVFVYV